VATSSNISMSPTRQVMIVDEATLRRVLGQFLDQRPGSSRVLPANPCVCIDHRGPLHLVIPPLGLSRVVALQFLAGGSGAAAVQAMSASPESTRSEARMRTCPDSDGRVWPLLARHGRSKMSAQSPLLRVYRK
jgi:hypothetical protein